MCIGICTIFGFYTLHGCEFVRIANVDFKHINVRRKNKFTFISNIRVLNTSVTESCFAVFIRFCGIYYAYTFCISCDCWPSDGEIKRKVCQLLVT